MDLIEALPRARDALASVRRPEAERIARMLGSHRVVGLLGEGEVGKTETVAQALKLAIGDADLVRLDLDAAASDPHIGFQLAKGVARSVAGEVDFSLLSAGALWPARIEEKRLELAELLGMRGLEEALREWPSGSFPAAAGFQLVEALSGRRPVVFWIDHLESPSLTPRHPVKVGELLWGIREMVQRANMITVVLSGRKAFEKSVLGPKQAFHQQGIWLTVDNPAAAAWREVAEQMQVWPALAEELAELTDGHPATMLQALLHVRQASAAVRIQDAHRILRDLAIRDDGFAGRPVQHARSLHRLGGQVLTQIALGQAPYGVSQRGRSAPQEIRKVLERLRLAGLIRPGAHWAIVNPLLAIRLRGSVAAAAARAERWGRQS